VDRTAHASLHVSPHFTLYSRSYCHLCQEMADALQALSSPAQPFCVEIIDVDADPALVAKYDELVPVLFGDPDGPELCHYFLDEGKVKRYLTQCNTTAAA
jgi:thiol-disulfide isomerase/thioredoxin